MLIQYPFEKGIARVDTGQLFIPFIAFLSPGQFRDF